VRRLAPFLFVTGLPAGLEAKEPLVLSLELAQPTATLNEPVFATLSTTNQLPEEVSLDLGSDRKGNLAFTITDPGGRRVPLPRKIQEGMSRIGRMTLRPGETYKQKILLDEWYSFEAPGTYSIEVTLASPAQTTIGKIITVLPSKPVSIRIVPRDPARLKDVCEKLAKTAIEATDVQTAMEAAAALSYVRDPIAVPFLESVLKEAKLVRAYALTGLARIANGEAVRALIAATREEDPELRAQAMYALSQAKARVQDEALKRQIEQVLAGRG
jgi:hypothetical protein